MSNDVDNKVVTMTFDNEKFAARMEETIKGLERLNQSLKMVEGAKGMADAQKQVNSFKMDGVQKTVAEAQAAMGKFNASPVVNAVSDAQGAVNKFDASNMGDQADGISAKWVAMAAAVFATVDGLVSKVVSSATAMGKSFSLGPIQSGFSDYETGIGSIQTILANTDRFGTSVEDVNKALDELNQYSNLTIYRFSDMTKNVGLFTNAGMKVEDATSVIKGFSNAAAASGTDMNGAASAAYQLSQAMSAGTVRIMDWRSLQNVGMGNKNMQAGIIEIADAMGTLKKSGVSSEEATAHFNETLQKGWLSADVMSNYLKIMAGDMSDAEMKTLGLDDAQIKAFKHQQEIAQNAAQKVRTFTQLVDVMKDSIGSGWSKTFRTLLGGFNGATYIFSAINDKIGGMIQHSAAARNKMLAVWQHFGGRFQLISIFKNAYKAIMSLINPIRWAFRAMFPKTTAGTLLKIGAAINNFLIKIRLTDDTVRKVANVFSILFAPLKILWMVVKGVTKVFGAFLGVLFKNKGSSGVLTVISQIGRALVVLEQYLEKHNTIGTFFDKIAGAVTRFGKILNSVLGFVWKMIAGFGKVVWNVMKAVGRAVMSVGHIFVAAFGYVEQLLGKVAGGIKDFWSGFTKGTDELGSSQSKFAQWGAVVYGWFARAKAAVKGFAHNFVAGLGLVKRTLQEVKSILFNGDFTGKGPWEEDSPIVNSLFTFREKVIGVFTGLKNSIKGIWSQGFEPTGKAIFDGIKKAITDNDWLGMLKDVGHKLYESFMRAIDAHSPSKMFEDAAVAIPQGIAKGIQGGWSTIKDAISWMGDKIRGVLDGFVDFVTSPKLTAALKNGAWLALVKMAVNLGGMFKNFGGLAKDLKGTMKSVTGAMDQAKGTLKTYQKSIRWNILKKIAISIGLLAASMAALSFIPPAKLAAGAGAVASALLGLTVAMKKMDKISSGRKKLNAMANTVRKIGEAILILALAVKILGDMKDRGNLAQGLIGVTELLGGLTLSIRIMAKEDKKMAGVGATLLGLAAGLLFLTFAVKTLGKMKDKGDLAQGLLAVFILLGAMGSAIGVMGEEETKLAGVSLALLAIGVSLNLVARAVKSIGKLKGDEIKRGLLGLAGGMAIVLASMYAMNKMNLEKASLGLLLMAFAMKGIAKIVQIFAAMKLGALVTGLLALAAVMAIVVVAANGLEEALPGAAAMLIIAVAITVLANAIQTLGNMKLGALLTGLLALVVAIVAIGAVSAILGLFSELILAFGIALTTVGIGVLAFGAGIYLLGQGIQQLIKAGSKGIDLFMKAMDTFIGLLPHWAGVFAKALLKMFSDFLEGMPELIGQFGAVLGALLDEAHKLLPKLFTILDDVIHGLIQLVRDNGPDFINAGIELLTSLLDGIKQNIGDMAQSAVEIVINFVEGVATAIEEHKEEIGNAARGLGKAMLDGIIAIFVPEGLQEAISNLVNGMVNWFKSLLGIHSPSTVFQGFGGDILMGLLNGLVNTVSTVLNFFISLPGKIIGALGDLLGLLVQKGGDLLTGLWNGAKNMAVSVNQWISGIGGRVLGAIGNLLGTLFGKGADIITGLWNGAKNMWTTVKNWLSERKDRALDVFSNAINWLKNIGGDILQGLWNGLKEKWEKVKNWFSDKIGWLKNHTIGQLGIGSPSKVFRNYGRWTMVGFHKGLEDGFEGVTKFFRNMGSAYDGISTDATEGLKTAVQKIHEQMSDLDGTQPTIAPVIDLTNVKMGVDAIGSMMDGQSINAGVSLDSARLISAATSAPKEQAPQPTTTDGGVTFIQNNYSPKALSEADIYRKTKGQVAKAREELGIAS